MLKNFQLGLLNALLELVMYQIPFKIDQLGSDLKRKIESEFTEKLRYKDEKKFTELNRKCAKFAIDNLSQLNNTLPLIPKELNDRAADNWEPLFSIAEVAGNNWPKLAHEAAIALSGSEKESVSISIELLIAIKNVFSQKTGDKISTTNLLSELCKDKEARWTTFNNGENISPKQLANRLREFDIYSKDIRLSTDLNLKGYHKKHFEDAFARYIPSNHRRAQQDCHEAAARHAGGGGKLNWLCWLERQ